jgi:hypothetical protein
MALAEWEREAQHEEDGCIFEVEISDGVDFIYMQYKPIISIP